MASRGTLHIVRNFNELDKSGVYDMAFTTESEQSDTGTANHIRRFFGEQELTEFLKKHLNRSADDVKKILVELHDTGHSRISDVELPDELRGLAA